MRIYVPILLLLAAACQREPARPLPARAPTVAASVSAPPTLVPAAPAPPKVRWGSKAPHAGVEFQMRREGDALIMTRRDAVLTLRPVPPLGECDDVPPMRSALDGLPVEDAEDRPLWWELRAPDEAASIRLSSEGALLVAHAGCPRAADVTRQLFGIAGGAGGFFGVDPIAPDEAIEAPVPPLREGVITLPTRLALPLVLPAGEATWGHLRHGTQGWVRLLVSEEIPLRGDDAGAGREHTLVWEYALDDAATPPILVLDNFHRYGFEGNDREATQTRIVRRTRHSHGELVVEGDRETVSDAMNVGAGRCPEMEGALAFRHVQEDLRFTFVTPSGARVALGEARRRVLSSSGCLEIARAETRKRTNRTLADRAPRTRVELAVEK